MPYIHSESSTKKSFSKITICLASSDTILSRSHGEVTKPETINYRSFRPEKDGLFCEKIFGPVRDWECHCGKYKRIRYKGIICDRCGVEVTQKSVRRERMGHIYLAVPVAHIWYFKSAPSKIGYVLGIGGKDLEKIIYYESYVVVQPGTTGLKQLDLLSEESYFEILASLPENNQDLDDSDERKFIADIGAPAVRKLLKKVDVEADIAKLRIGLKEETSAQKKLEMLKRLRVLDAFRDHGTGVLNKPEWMILEVIPVIPPELRPLVPLEGGRFATSDLNDLYRRVIIRNNRLKRLIDIKAPEVILRNEKRMLQEAVDSLFDNSRRMNAVRADNNRALKSLADMLKGKQGRFRQNLLGKRVDYSGRSVIVVGPELKLHECGIPKDMAVELFKPFIIRKLIERGIVKTVKSAKKIVDKKGSDVWEVLENIIDGHPVLLNRAPTLHRLGIQAFQPILVEGKAIRIHPMVCTAFNADFDGDQMAVHIPLSYHAQLEARVLMLSSHNILSPANGAPIVHPTQDQVLGCYYLTKSRAGDIGEGKLFSSPEEVIIAHNSGKVGLHARIKVRIDGQMMDTTTGRVIFNSILPKEIGYINELLNKKRLVQITGFVYRRVGNLKTAEFLDQLKELGFKYATQGGLSVSVGDVIIPKEKEEIITKAQKDVDNVQNQYYKGFITTGERYNKVIDIWSRATTKVADKLFDSLQHSLEGFNSLYMMVDSGARGSKEQIRQLAGMRGLMAKPQKSLLGSTGELIENPIIANFREGLSVLEYFISTHGARKGLADTALKTADAGYLTRRLVDVAQDAIITYVDCGTILGVTTGALKEGEDVKEPLSERILGRVTVNDVVDPITGKLLAPAGVEITEEVAQKISETSIETVDIRSVLTCEAPRGICAKCYGRNLTRGELVKVGEVVGIIGAQSIGEPGTQLTLRTFHTGGTASLIAAQSQITSKFDGIIKYEGIKSIRTDDSAHKSIVTGRSGVVMVYDNENRLLTKYDVPYGALLLVQNGSYIKKGEIIYEWDPYNNVIVSEHAGKVEYSGLKENVTYRQEPDEQTGYIHTVVIDSRDKTLSPSVIIKNDAGVRIGTYNIPTHSHIVVDNGEKITAGTVLVKIPRAQGKTRDITGGLPRVTELFEARSPVSPALVSEIDGMVHFGPQKRGSREIIISSIDNKDQKQYLVPLGKHILAQENDFVRAGERLTDGTIDPHDILRIKGVGKVQEYLVNEIQEVYRLQGVKINDKHIEIIVRRMMQKVKIVDPGDTRFLEGDIVDKLSFLKENEEIKDKIYVANKGDSKLKNGQLVTKKEIRELNSILKKKSKKIVEYREADPATSEPVLLGITNASLSTDSFISAASFQETTKVLTDAAIAGKVDHLLGLKENVIVGHLIPAGTGLKKFQNILVTSKELFEIPLTDIEPKVEIVEITEKVVEPKKEVKKRVKKSEKVKR
ncbi:MAG: DNA-directed RNA polymerase subunit beta' [Bacteroidetes bacterium]|nr:DNA-directed RNA polymerase subunit beta' [Bacteroidota bacterium]MBU1422221.1 DNA-directed RNA polymerase subunit beta' [Bacteroidota bacterium]MBU2636086.1 DNA-directed RNA polymerase subunit beta' [Bacteroidota bacterium]